MRKEYQKIHKVNVKFLEKKLTTYISNKLDKYVFYRPIQINSNHLFKFLRFTTKVIYRQYSFLLSCSIWGKEKIYLSFYSFSVFSILFSLGAFKIRKKLRIILSWRDIFLWLWLSVSFSLIFGIYIKTSNWRFINTKQSEIKIE